MQWSNKPNPSFNSVRPQSWGWSFLDYFQDAARVWWEGPDRPQLLGSGHQHLLPPRNEWQRALHVSSRRQSTSVRAPTKVCKTFTWGKAGERVVCVCVVGGGIRVEGVISECVWVGGGGGGDGWNWTANGQSGPKGFSRFSSTTKNQRICEHQRYDMPAPFPCSITVTFLTYNMQLSKLLLLTRLAKLKGVRCILWIIDSLRPTTTFHRFLSICSICKHPPKFRIPTLLLMWKIDSVVFFFLPAGRNFLTLMRNKNY